MCNDEFLQNDTPMKSASISETKIVTSTPEILLLPFSGYYCQGLFTTLMLQKFEKWTVFKIEKNVGQGKHNFICCGKPLVLLQSSSHLVCFYIAEVNYSIIPIINSNLCFKETRIQQAHRTTTQLSFWKYQPIDPIFFPHLLYETQSLWRHCLQGSLGNGV